MKILQLAIQILESFMVYLAPEPREDFSVGQLKEMSDSELRVQSLYYGLFLLRSLAPSLHFECTQIEFLPIKRTPAMSTIFELQWFHPNVFTPQFPNPKVSKIPRTRYSWFMSHQNYITDLETHISSMIIIISLIFIFSFGSMTRSMVN